MATATDPYADRIGKLPTTVGAGHGPEAAQNCPSALGTTVQAPQQRARPPVGAHRAAPRGVPGAARGTLSVADVCMITTAMCGQPSGSDPQRPSARRACRCRCRGGGGLDAPLAICHARGESE
jgi:hypothetical protein